MKRLLQWAAYCQRRSVRSYVACVMGMSCNLASVYAADLAPSELVAAQSAPSIVSLRPQSQVALGAAPGASFSSTSGPSLDPSGSLTIQQRGSGNTVSATLAAGGNAADIQQSGILNSAGLIQQGGNLLSLTQAGVGQHAEIQQIRGGPAIGIQQIGGSSFVKAFQF